MKGILLLFILGVSLNTYAQTKSQNIDNLLTMLNKQSQFNGTILIIDNGKQVLKKSYGFSNIETQEKLNENSIFELASLSKQFTATAIILLKQQGKLNYTNEVITYFPELKYCKGVTIRNLLNHSSGLPDYIGMMIKNWDKSKTATNKDVIEMLGSKVDTLSFAPNSGFSYSNSNYVLLGSIIEQVSKKPFSKYMDNQIFRPLKMTRSSIVNRRYKPITLKNFAYGYVTGEEQNLVLPDSLEYSKYVVYLDGIVGDGMVNSTVNDLEKWDQSFRNNTLITEEELDFVMQLDTLSNGKTNTYAFGWNIKQNSDHSTMSHSGSWPGYVTYISRTKEKENLIVILQNFDEIVLPIKTINEILNDKPITKNYKKEVKLSLEILKKFTGTYIDVDDTNAITTLTLGKNALLFSSTNNPWNMPFYPDSENTFFSKAPRLEIGFEFITQKNGVIELIFLQNGKKIGTSIKEQN